VIPAAPCHRRVLDRLNAVTVASCSVAEFAPGDISETYSFAMDAWFEDVSILTDEPALLTVMREAAEAGHATVVGQASAIFPNGAVTAALLLAESHLTVHTWPEHGLARFDLLTCGRLSAEMIIGQLQSALKPTRSDVRCTARDAR
jgi:S-adenosylmethionine decarboxylase